ncbi:hypothetical protein EK904_012162 [Melospiza melodia maxima]|nr:hypothetical protein EK904_012162 [Melospiza melodia maxima]
MKIILTIAQVNALINMLLGELTPGDHQNIMTICTIDVHARDVVATLIAQKCNKEHEANGSNVQEIYDWDPLMVK